ncbi:unnamed protein product [Caenorhabditis auriculariae]|uniref:cGMP-dependent protein kinase interacting domain-containing protein n=1 Tax=Caenorhabditis auriculariae TaxID=2777116 RepID=A0A8S1HP79_9PELO|nr:unnamed protein product [Caenorhabditis auriculariae]
MSCRESHVVWFSPPGISQPTVLRSSSIPTNLPWASLWNNVNNSSHGHLRAHMTPHQQQLRLNTSPSILTSSRISSAFRPLQKSSSALPPPATSSAAINEYPRGFQPQQINPIKMSRWQSKTVTESEAERRNNSRMQRQHRRSTQGVTKEQLEEASRLASEETARRHSAVSSTSAPSSAIVRLASEERDLTNSESERSQPERDGDVSATASVPLNSMSNNQANVRRKSQALSFSRTNRRGTGPVMADDVVQAAALRTNGGHGDIASSPTTLRLAAVSATSPSTFSSTSSSSATTPRAYISGTSMSSAASRYSNGEDKATSLPPSSHTSSVAQSAASQRSAVVAGLSTAPSSARVVTATSRFGPTNVSTSTPSYLAQSRPTETNLNYKALYEKERAECDRLRKEVDELRRSNDRPSSNSTSTSNWRLRNTSPSSNASASLTVAKSSSLASFDESERRSMERRITDLESQLKELKKLRNDNDRLKEENGALVRVISKMTS